MINLCSIDCLSDPEIKLEFKEKRLILVVTAQDEEANTEQEHKFVFVLGKSAYSIKIVSKKALKSTGLDF